jgi:hypothetical protein
VTIDRTTSAPTAPRIIAKTTIPTSLTGQQESIKIESVVKYGSHRRWFLALQYLQTDPVWLPWQFLCFPLGTPNSTCGNCIDACT